MNAESRRKTLLQILAIGLVLTALALGAHAQGPPNQVVPWGSGLLPVVLGSGVEIRPGQIAVLNAGVDGTNYIWQNKVTKFTLLDYSDAKSTISSLHINAWAEYDGWTASGKFSFDYSNYQAYNGNERRWEVDADRLWTAAIPSPQLTPTAITYHNNAAQFESLYGNYAVTGIAYRRHIRILFDVVFNSNVSSSQWSAAVQGSYGCFSGGISASQEQTNLDACGTTTITVEVDGDSGGTIIASGSSGNLSALQTALANQLQQWDTAPADANDAGTVDTAYLTTYQAVTPPANTTKQQSPDQIKLTNALVNLVQLLTAQQRLHDISTTEA